MGSRTDVVIIGAGAAGAGAAIEAAARGATVAVIDSASAIGGTARYAGGGICMAGSPLQEQLGIADSPDIALNDWLTWGGPSADEEWARRYLEGVVMEIYERLCALGIRWGKVNWNEGNSVPRWHAPLGGGRAIMHALAKEAHRYSSIEWLLGSRVTELVVAGGRVVGVAGDGSSGPFEQRADSVLVASGGFSNNASMVREHATAARSAQKVLLGGGPGAVGVGHRMLARVQAQFVDMDAVWMYAFATPDYRSPNSERGLVLRSLDGDIWVNGRGQRFHDESRRGGATGTPALLSQRPATCWSIIDARIAARYTVSDPVYRHGVTPIRRELDRLLAESPYITKGDDLWAVAEGAGIDGQQLTETVSSHNRVRASGRAHDPEHGRPLVGVEPLTQPPFYAIQLFPMARKNLGGVLTNLDCQVVDRGGRTVPGLFAAGEVAGMAGGHINGRAALEGTMFGPSLYSGLVAGRCMTS
ncbi:MAG: FAD-dependent oxidoreductase [Nitriliruptorales bacterium]|nr:FAD-dependent oxidoreductase [Nitriliruptorales bacterium]